MLVGSKLTYGKYTSNKFNVSNMEEVIFIIAALQYLRHGASSCNGREKELLSCDSLRSRHCFREQ